METAKQDRSDAIPVFFPSIAPHLRESAVLKMLHEEEPSGKVRGSQWPPEGSNIAHKPTSFFTKVSRGPGGRPVEWPPRPSQEENKQVSASAPNDGQAPPPVPPRPANYPQANMDQSQHQQQQQMMSQQQQVQQQVQQQQHRQQVTSSSEMRTVKQTYHVQQQQHQTYEQQGHQVGGFQQQALQYQQPQQQNVQYQMSQQTSSTAFQQLPASREQMMPSVFQNGAPAHPQAHTAPAPAPGHVSAPAPAPAPGPAPGPFPNPNAAPQHYANQNGTMPQHAPAPEGEDPLPAQILPQYQAPPGYSTAYTAVHGEWPPKNENAPNMTTTYPSGFKLREQAPVEQAPARVVTSQPAFKMTQPIRKSGDSKWPPKGNMEPTQQEVREFIKPRKSNKDYTEFFAQNALPHNYAGYRPPPGTQHRGGEEEGVSNM